MSEQFTDGNFTKNPEWSGDTADFIVNTDRVLQLFAAEKAASSNLYTPSPVIENATWVFSVMMDFNPSSANYADVYLAADNHVLDSSKGYFVRIGNTEDEVSLYRQDGIRSEKEEIIDGRDDVIDDSYVNVSIKVTRGQSGHWSLYSKPRDSTRFTREGDVFENTYLSSTYFGLHCNYTKTRSQKFFFDDISVEGNSKSDTLAPEIVNTEVKDKNSLNITFSEAVLFNDINTATHFFEQCNLQHPVEVDVTNDSIVQVIFEAPFPENDTCELMLKDISDHADNHMDSVIQFTYVPPYQPGPYELFITELMPDPTPNRELPEHEYIELYNPNAFELEVENLEIRMTTKSRTIESFTIPTQEYLILCPSSAEASFDPYGNTIGLTKWPTLLNRGDTISLVNKYNERIFTLAYNKNWYKSLDKENGGWSLEMIDVRYPCRGLSNWMASTDEQGGSPGRKNASSTDNPDLNGPEINKATVINQRQIVIHFNESIDTTSISENHITFSPPIAIEKIESIPQFYKNLVIHLSDDLQQNTPYAVEITNIRDCSGNIIEENEKDISIVLPLIADSLDIVFNELLFDPHSNGSDFIELYNTSDKYIDLKNWQIANNLDPGSPDIKTISKDHFIVEPNAYVVLTPDIENIKLNYPTGNAKAYFTADIPAMNNDEGRLKLINEEGKLIDQVYYRESFHHSILNDTEGVSLERIHHTGSSNNSAIWQSAAEVVGFATPGTSNSQAGDLPYNTKAVKISPAVFAPDNDGYRDFTSITYDFDAPNYLATVEIFDMEGVHIKSLAQNSTLSQKGFFTWDGTNEQGNKVNIGYYIVLFEAIGPKGKKITYKKKVAVAAKF